MGFYASPREVLRDASLEAGQKREILQSWKAESIHLQESTAEGFGGGERSHLDAVCQALSELDGGG